MACHSGKYPEITFKKYDKFVEETELDMYEDKGRGYTSGEYKAYITLLP